MCRDRCRATIGPEVTIDPGAPDEHRTLKVNAFPLPAGGVIHVETEGGGGFGAPHERDPERIRADILDGYVTIEAARRDDGVEIDPATLEWLGRASSPR